MCSYLKLEIKSFVALKNESFLFWMRVQFKGEGGVKFSKILRGGSDRFRFFFFWGGGGGGMGGKKQ